MKNADYCRGEASASPRITQWGWPLLSLLGLLWLACAGSAWGQSGGAANLDQIRNGSFSSRLDPPNWVNGNAGAQNAHYLEGHSIGYRLVLSNLSAGVHTVVIGWDVRDNGKNALDFITHYQNLVSHSQFNHPAETIDPLLGLGLSGASVVTAAIPAPSQIPAGLPFSYYQLQASGKEVMTMFNGTSIDNLNYVTQGNRGLAHAETQLAITFHTVQPTVVLAWGGHIASQVDWGPGTSAVSINGSPYHTRLISLDGSGGNQDRSLSADAVVQPPTCAFTGPSLGCTGQALTFTGPAGMSSYQWTVTGGGATPSSGTGQAITVTATSSYTIQLVTTKSGLTSSDDCQQTVTINPGTAITALTDLTRCPGEVATFSTTASGTGPFTYAWTKDGVPLADATGPSYTVASVSAADAGTYAVTVTGVCGSDTRSATLRVNENIAATALVDLTRCSEGSATFSTTASGTGPFTYSWAKDGSPIPTATDPSYTIAAVSAADAGTYAVTVTGLCGSITRSATLLVNPVAQATALSPLTQCDGTSATFSTTASGTGPFTYSWTKDGSPIAGATDPSYTIAALSLADAGTYAVTVTGVCGSATQSASLTVTGCTVQHCTLTQGGYGNANGVICKYPGVRRTQLIANMLKTTDVVLGVPGRSLTYAHTAGTGSAAEAARLATAQCIIGRLPGAGTAAAFPAFGSVSGCGPLPAAILRNGKFNNVLIGQTLTLALNMRLDTELADVVLNASMTSYSALNCDGADPADLTGITRLMPASVLGNLSYSGATPTVAALLNLANKALGGASYANAGGNPSLTDISSAAGAINELFDNCRMYRSASPALAARGGSGNPALASASVRASVGEMLHAYPNPFSASTTLEFVLPQKARYQLLVFDMTGRQVARLGAGSAEPGVRYSFSLSGLQEGVYLARLVTDAGQQTVRLSLMR